MSSSRRLAAIMFTDIVGYTALMQRNEAQAVDTIKRYLAVLRQTVCVHSGKILNDYGDGSLCIFSSAIEAAQCAVEMQKQLRQEQVVPLRIGLHIGEIFFEGKKVFGDGVNVASRFQSLGQGNTILFSKEIFDTLRNHPEFKTISLGRFDFKNVDEPMEVFALTNEGLVVPKREKMEGKLKEPKRKNIFGLNVLIAALVVIIALTAYLNYSQQNDLHLEKSIAVLPFTNMSNDPEQEYFAEGTMDEILNHLFKIGGLKVVSRTSSMSFKDSKKTTKEIAEELGVANLLEGSVQKNGDSIRIIVKLINGKTDQQLWGDAYNKEYKDIFAIQSDIAERIASELKIKIDPDLKRRIEYVPTENTKAYTLILQAAEDLYAGKGSARTKELIEQAIALDSNFADAYAWLAIYWLNQGGYDGDLGREDVKAKAEPLLQKALNLNPDLAVAHVGNTFFQLYNNWNFEAVDEEYKKVLQLNPSNSQFIIIFSTFLNAVGRHSEALQNSLNAFKTDKNISETWYFLAADYYFNNQPDKAEQTITTASSLFSTTDVFTWYIKIKVWMGKYDDATAYFEKLDFTINPTVNPSVLAYIAIAYYETGQKDKTEKALSILNAKNNRSPAGSPAYSTALVYAAMKQQEEAIKWLEKSYDEHEVNMCWLKVEPLFKPLHDDSRFQSLLKRLGFPT